MNVNIFKGGVVFHKIIDQILSYLTCRNNFGVIITFSKIQRFSKIVEDIEDQITSHLSYIGNYKKISETHFSFFHSLPIDKGKEVELHHLFYNLYTK